MKPKTWAHPKFALLQRRLGICPALAAGILEGIWHLAATFDDECGTLPYTDDELAAWLGVDLPPDELVSALVDGRWLDHDGHKLIVHDWLDHRPAYVNDRIRMRTVRNCSRTPSNSFEQSAPSDSASVLINPPIPPSSKGGIGNGQPKRQTRKQRQADEKAASEARLAADRAKLRAELDRQRAEKQAELAADRKENTDD